MVSDLMGDEFYLNIAKALSEYDRGTIQFAQVSGALDEGVEVRDGYGFRRTIG